MDKQKVIQRLSSKHEGTKVLYTSCAQNGCWDSCCIMRYHVKDGKVVCIEPDDTINCGDAREDVGERAIKQGMVQMRGCAMGYSWMQELYSPNRILHPMKRIGEKGFGNGEFVEISWEEALDTIAEKIRATIDEYGPYSIYQTYTTFDLCGFTLAPWLKAGVAAWGDHSTSGCAAAEEFHTGFELTDVLIKGISQKYPGSEAPDLLNSNLIILWGMDPLVAWFGPKSYYMRLAKERGCKVVCIDPRYTVSAEVIADQWIPIRPGTDTAMMLAMAYVLFDEDLYDHEYVEKWAEPEGFEKYRAYILGETDGVAKTPEWAEETCAVPAETIRGLTQLYAKSKPVHLQVFYAVSKRHTGDYATAAAMLLQIMTGNFAIPGGCQTGSCLPTPPRIPAPSVDWQRAPYEYFAPVLFNNNKLSETLTCQDDFWSGKMSEQEFRSRIGSPADAPLPNIQMLILDCNYVNNQHNVNKRMKAFSKPAFSWGWLWHHDQPTIEFLDIVLPAPVYMFEGMDGNPMGQERFLDAPSALRNYQIFLGRGADLPGEVRPKEWVWTQLAKRLGIVDKYNPRMADVELRDWDDALEDLYEEAYENWAQDYTGALAYNGIQPPTWDDLQSNPVIRFPIERPHYPFMATIESGDTPFNTPSGKAEFYSTYVEKTDLSKTKWRGSYDPMPTCTPSYMNGQEADDSFYNEKAEKFPLSLVTPVSAYRQHSCLDGNPLLRGDCYRHAVWISVSDAKKRGIADGDTVRVHNEFGEMEISAFVTSRMMPGTVSIHHGAWLKPTGKKTELSPIGTDTNGACNLLIGDRHLPHIIGALLTAGLVEIEKVDGETR